MQHKVLMEDQNPRKPFDEPKPPTPDYTKSESEINKMIQESKQTK